MTPLLTFIYLICLIERNIIITFSGRFSGFTVICVIGLIRQITGHFTAFHGAFFGTVQRSDAVAGHFGIIPPGAIWLRDAVDVQRAFHGYQAAFMHIISDELGTFVPSAATNKISLTFSVWAFSIAVNG